MSRHLLYEDETIEGFPGKEGKEILSRSVIFRRCNFVGGSTNLRVNGSTLNAENCEFEGVAGPADPDGQCVQFLRSVGQLVGCVFNASADSEDLVSVYADKPVAGTVLIQNCLWRGRGRSNSGTSLCIDEQFPPPTHVLGGTIDADPRTPHVLPRCGITIAGGGGHVIENVVINAETTIYVANLYGAANFGPVLIKGCTLSSPPLIGPGVGRFVKVIP